jgi:4-amino-4-deoxy-L-arabinose transferase-like glycosyltransferase
MVFDETTTQANRNAPRMIGNLGSRDYFLLMVFSVVLFAYSTVGGRPLTMHEARLPQTAREMQISRNYLFPTSGGRTWLERPPLPHWVMIAVATAVGHNDRVLFVRLPSALLGCMIVLLTAWMASGWFGRSIGLVSGFVLATMYEFWAYSSLAEDDIYLAALVAVAMAVFVHGEFFSRRCSLDSRTNFFATRPWQVLVVFALIGLTNLTKGPLLGVMIAASTIGAYQVLTADRRRVLRYVWLWGWLLLIALTLAWPIAAYLRYPDVLDNWRFDYLGRLGGRFLYQPPWYYLGALAMNLAPWTALSIFGLWSTRQRVRSDRVGPERFLWCWAIVPVLVFSIPQGKHHHYLLPIVAPWAIVTAIGWTHVSRAILQVRPHFKPRNAMASILIVLLLGYSAGQTMFAARSDGTVEDTKFLREARMLVPENSPLFINADIGSMDFFRLQYYSRADAILLHNLTYLRDERIRQPSVYVITRARDQSKLETFGRAQVIAQSLKSHDDGGKPEGRFTLFRLQFDAKLTRYPAPQPITALQAMGRDEGPYCGPKL